MEKTIAAAVLATAVLGALSSSAAWYDDDANLDVSSLPTAYIESDGTSYIDTGYTPTTNTAIACDFEYTDVTAQQFVFEASDSVNATNANYKAYFRTYISGAGKIAWAMNRNLWQNPGFENIAANARYSIFLNSPGYSVVVKNANQHKTTAVEKWSMSRKISGTTLKLFANGSGNANKAKARIYQMKIFEDGELVRDFTPATKGDVIGFVDQVTGDFIGSASGMTISNTGTETVLPEDDPYIESDGTMGINTGVQTQPGLKIEVDFQIVGDPIVAQWRIVANDAGSDNTWPRGSAYVNSSLNFAVTSGDTWQGTNSTGIPADTLRHKVVLGDANNKCYLLPAYGRNVLGSMITGNAYTKRSMTQFALLATPKANIGSSHSNRSKARIYGAKFWVNGKLIRDFRPRTLNGVAGLEEVVHGGFYTSEGYTASANVPEGLTSTPAYIENDGSFFSYVNTYYHANQKSKFEVEYQVVKMAGSGIVWGEYGGSAGLSCLMWHDSTGKAYPQVRDGSYAAPTTTKYGYEDAGRHTSIIDVPARVLRVLDADGNVETEGTAPESTATANFPILLFGAAKDKYGHSTQLMTGRIYSAKIWEKEGEEYVLVHDFKPVLCDGLPGFMDQVSGQFFSGDKLTGGGAIENVPDVDPYLENPSDGGRYFDTGYHVTKDTSIWMDIMPRLQHTTQMFTYEAGVANENGTMFMRAYANGSEAKGDFSHAFGTDAYKSTFVPYQPNARVQVFHDTVNKRFSVMRGDVELGGTNYASWATSAVTAQSAGTLKLLCKDAMGGNNARCRLYGVKIWENGVLVRDYVPVAQANTGMLRDRVTGALLKKASTKDFIVSPDLVSKDAWLTDEMRAGDAYIESDGSQVINTGYIGKPTTRFEVDFQLVAINGQNRIFGSVTGNSIAEMYIQGSNVGSGNVAFLVGDAQKTQAMGEAADLNRHRGILDIFSHSIGYSGYGYKAELDAFTSTHNTGPVGLFVKNTTSNSFSGWEQKHVAKMRLYAFRVYEEGRLVHQFLPYKNGDVIGLYDTVTGDIKGPIASGFGTFKNFTYGGEGYGAYVGEPIDLVVKPADCTVSTSGRTLTAYAPGAVAYRWTKNGEVIAGETNATLRVDWERGQANREAVIGAAPVFSIDGEEVVGNEETATVTMAPLGLAIIFR